MLVNPRRNGGQNGGQKSEGYFVRKVSLGGIGAVCVSMAAVVVVSEDCCCVLVASGLLVIGLMLGGAG